MAGRQGNQELPLLKPRSLQLANIKASPKFQGDEDIIAKIKQVILMVPH
jgi:hypothetical protein